MATQKNTNDLLAQAAATLPDNSTQLISPADVREAVENTAVSSYNKITDSALVGLKEFSVLPTYESGQGCINGGKIYISNTITGPGAFAPGDWDLYDELSAADKAKIDFLTITGAVDLDDINTAVAANTAKVTFPEAPIDGTQYARKDGAWEAVAAGGTAFSDVIYVDSESGDNGTGEVGNASKPFLTPEYVVSNVVNTGTITGNTATNTTISNISDAHNANLKVGQWLSGSGFNYGTIIVAKGNEGGNANTITLNKATTATATGVTITWYVNYLVKCTGSFNLVGVVPVSNNLYKDGFCFDFGNSIVILDSWVAFYGYNQRHTPFILLGGYWFGREYNSYLFGANSNSFHDIAIDIHRFESNTTYHGILLGGDGIQKYGTLKVTCPYFYCPFGRISTTEGQNTSTTELNFTYAYGALGGINYRYGNTIINGHINTPAAINAIEQVGLNGILNFDGVIQGSASLAECRIKGYIVGNTLTITGTFFGNSSLNAHVVANVVTTGTANSALISFIGAIRGDFTNIGARVFINKMYGSYLSSGDSYGEISFNILEASGTKSITLNDASVLYFRNMDDVVAYNILLYVNNSSIFYNTNFFKGSILAMDGTLQNTGEMRIAAKTSAITGTFINRGKITITNGGIENPTSTPTIEVTTGKIILDGGELICPDANSLSGLIRKTADGGKVILKGGAYLKTANGLSPLQILSNAGTAQDIMVFDAVTNSAAGFGLLDTFSDVTYGTAYAPNDIAGGQLLQNTNFDF